MGIFLEASFTDSGNYIIFSLIEYATMKSNNKNRHIRTYKINNARYVGLCINEIVAFPYVDGYDKESQIQNMIYFTSLMNEVYDLLGYDSCMEILWMPERVNNQAFKSRIHVYFILRKISDSREKIISVLNNVEEYIESCFDSHKYEYEIVNRLFCILGR